MDPDRERLARAIADQASRLDPGERRTFLEGACRGDTPLLQRVLALFEHAEDPTAMPTSDAPASAPPGSNPDQFLTAGPLEAPIPPGERLGRYRVVRVIGQGGMGTVYEALQESPRRPVALKVMRHGLASRSAQRRFEYESQLLARLRHPGIAQVYEAGTHDIGGVPVPFFAMEYIPGAATLTEFAARRNLGVRERLELLAQVCDAVQAGHARGIVHRDLKPANILVDSSGHVKVIDFGVARATDADAAITTDRTLAGQLVGTLPYMSPEQCGGDPSDLDVRSDVYSLGVVMYELLVGRLPHDLLRAAVAEAIRVIRDEPPPRLSTANPALRGDVETITLKALSKDRERRYRSAAELGDDLRRFLREEPITAHPPSVVYQLRLMARRHRGLAGAVAVSLGVMLVAAGLVTWQAVRATRAEAEARRLLAEATLAREAETEQRRLAESRLLQAETERRRAARVADFMQGVFRGIDPQYAVGMDTRLLRRLAEDALLQLDRGLADAPDLAAELRGTFGVVFLTTGEWDRAQRLLEAALASIAAREGPDSPAALGLRQELGVLLAMQGRHAEAHDRLAELVQPMSVTFGDDSVEAARLNMNIGLVAKDLGRFDEALTRLQGAAEVLERAGTPGDARALTARANVGLVHAAAGRLSDAERVLRPAADDARRSLGLEHPVAIRTINNLGIVLAMQRRVDEAYEILAPLSAAMARTYGPDHPESVSLERNLGALAFDAGKMHDAADILDRALDRHERVFGPAHPATMACLSNLAAVRSQLGQTEQARALYERALDVLNRASGPGHPTALIIMENLSGVYEALGLMPEADAILQRALTEGEQVLGPDHPDHLLRMARRGAYLRRIGRAAEAIELLLPAIDRIVGVLGPDHPDALEAEMNLALTRADLGQPEDAEVLLRRVIEAAGTALVGLDASISLSRLLASQSRHAEAEPFALASAEGYERVFGRGSPDAVASARHAADVLRASGKDADAEAWLARAGSGSTVPADAPASPDPE